MLPPDHPREKIDPHLECEKQLVSYGSRPYNFSILQHTEVYSLTTATQRLEMRDDKDIKKMAERASAALGCNVTEYVTRLILENAPKVLEEQSRIELTNQQFERFLTICDQGKPLSPRIRKAAERLDEEGL